MPQKVYKTNEKAKPLGGVANSLLAYAQYVVKDIKAKNASGTPSAGQVANILFQFLFTLARFVEPIEIEYKTNTTSEK